MGILRKTAKSLLIFIIIISWLFNYPPNFFENLGGLRIWQKPAIPPEIQKVLALDCGFGSASGTVCIGFIDQTASTTWTVPNDWNSGNNKIECVGAGGDGSTGTAAARPGAGGGGGSYAYITNQSLSPGSVDIIIAAGGSAASTYLKNNGGSIVLSCGAGGNASTITPGSGGTAETGTGSSGGAGGDPQATNYYPGGGGGGSAGRSGIGKAGGRGGAGVSWGGGGGGGSNAGSSTAGATSTSATGGNGGNGTYGTGGGIGGAGTGPNATSSTGGGGAGGAGRASGTPGYAGGNGAIDISFNASYGAGGGGGGGGGSNVNPTTGGAGGNGGTYGGGGGGGGGGRVTASGAGGKGGQGLIVITYTPATVPGAPTNLATTIVASGQVDLSWASSTDGGSAILYYKIYRDTASPATTFLASTTNATSSDTTVVNGTTYFYRVTAKNAVGESGYSNEVSATPQAAATISCSSDPSTSFSPLSASSITTSAPPASTTMSCSNTSFGCALYVKDQGNGSKPGLATTSPAHLIPSPWATTTDATATLSPGIEGYGIQATTTSAGLTIATRYNQTGNTVGGLSLTDIIIASSTANITNAEVIITHKAVISQTTLSGSYEDTITYSCFIND